jgi:hypothetical protein
MEQAPGDAAAAPLIADQKRREVGLDLAVGLQLDESRDLPVLERDERRGACLASARSVRSGSSLKVSHPAASTSAMTPSRCSRSNALMSVSAMQGG